MKKLFIIANWKSNKTKSEATEWFQTVHSSQFTVNSDKEVIVCPSFTLLPILKSLIINHKSFIKLGAQDISPFGEGAYTGEINGKQIKEFADYVIVGHSERRRYFNVGEETLQKQVDMANQFGLIPIYCAASSNDFVPRGVKHITYEPPASISPGPADNPENAEGQAVKLCDKYNVEGVFYGGNVTSQNVHSFVSMPHINGVLVGRASLDAQEFSQLIQNA